MKKIVTKFKISCHNKSFHDISKNFKIELSHILKLKKNKIFS